MQVFELRFNVILQHEIIYQEVIDAVAKLVDSALAKDEDFLKLHMKRGYKKYCLDGLYPVEKDGVYKEDKHYSFHVRTVDTGLAKHLLIAIPMTNTGWIKGLTGEIKIIPCKTIQTIYSITPIIFMTESGKYWRNEWKLDEFEKQLITNLYKKYRDITGKSADETQPLYSSIAFTNKKPIKMVYKSKNVSLLGDKVSIEVETNETAQEQIGRAHV